MKQELPDPPMDTVSQSGVAQLNAFDELTEIEVQRLIEGCSKKSCILDPMPTSLVLHCSEVLLPVIAKMINLSLQSGFARSWKCAVVKPLLKKSGLDFPF